MHYLWPARIKTNCLRGNVSQDETIHASLSCSPAWFSIILRRGSHLFDCTLYNLRKFGSNRRCHLIPCKEKQRDVFAPSKNYYYYHYYYLSILVNLLRDLISCENR